MKDMINHYQKKLRLSKSLTEIYEAIPYENKDQFIHDFLKALHDERMENIIERNIRASRFPSRKTFEDLTIKILHSLKGFLLRPWNL